jgi:hypothetical protein
VCLRQSKPHSALHNFDFCHHHLFTCFELDIIIPGEKFDLIIHDLELYNYDSGKEFDLIIYDLELYDYDSGKEFDIIIMVQFYDYIYSNKHHDYYDPRKELHITVLNFSLQAHHSFSFREDQLPLPF